MMHNLKKTHITKIILFIVLLLQYNTVFAQRNEMRDFNVDSTLYHYYQRCKENTQSASVLQMADTLFRMAKSKGDQRMQAVALSTSLDYYYYQGIEDSIREYTNRVKTFASHTHQSKYYYFAWGKRLIQFYIKSGKINTALYESEEMLKTAQQADDKAGLATCYGCLATIYQIRKLEEQAFECKLKELELIETYGLDKYNVAMSYTDIAKYYLQINNTAKAWEALKKAEVEANTSAQKSSNEACLMKYYLALGDSEKALKSLQRIQHLFKTDKRLEHFKKTLYDAEVSYYTSTKQYQKALDALEKNHEEQARLGETSITIENNRRKGYLYWLSGNKEKAADYLQDYIMAQDSIASVNEQKSSGEFSALLGLEKLKADKQQVELDSKKKQLQYTRRIIILLIISLGGAFIFIWREHHLNQRLKKSEEILIKKNLDLLESGVQLNIAKDKAEKASLMKTAFIQNMTHEIRTPLNSIVGFSQILSSIFKDQDDTKEFANIIEDNSKKLLKLIDDVLSISDMESNASLEITDTDITDCCQQSISQVLPYVKKGVTCELISTRDTLVIQSNIQGLSQILFNLLHNAAKFTDEGNITLSYKLSEDKRNIFISVTDTGKGIPLDKQEEAFERFSKLDDFSQGSGLGLSISRLMAHKLGGQLSIDNEYMNGTRFILALPV